VKECLLTHHFSKFNFLLMQFLITFSLGKRSPTMNYTALVALLLASSATAFAPATTNGRVETTLSAKKSAEPQKKSLAGRIFDLDLFAPVADQNDYGARSKKKIVTGKITDKSYVPSGLTKAQYEKIRAEERARKEANYKAKMAKAGIFEDFTEWYKQRGTDLNQSWVKSVTRGHTMVKTKYDWSGTQQDARPWAKVVNPLASTAPPTKKSKKVLFGK
jgi:hypothetical protein